jgi:hypothetical protein
MSKLAIGVAAALLVLAGGAAGGAPLSGVPQAPAGTAAILAAKKLGVIPANCTMDPFKKVYVCCTQDSSGEPVCTEHPLDTDWPVQQKRTQKFKAQQTQPQPLLLFEKQPGATQ